MDKNSLTSEVSKLKQNNAKLKDKIKHNEQQLRRATNQSDDEVSKILTESTAKLENQLKLVTMLKNDKETLNKKVSKLEDKIKKYESDIVSKDEEIKSNQDS